ncbi:MAG: carbon-nitrogen hydrolase family protein [Eubacteriales bacterium]|nr:carbon-nitrogen hydrolase family protein [Eubacteriales bacterium]
MKIALYQMKMSSSMEENQRKSLEAIREAAENGADLIVFPEIQYCTFFPQYEKQDASVCAMTEEHPFVRQIKDACAKYHIMAAPNIYLLKNEKYYDATLLIDSDGTLIGLQKMVHIAQAEEFYEQDYYTPSEEGFQVFRTPFGKIGIVVCFDRHYPESIRTEALLGADLILIPTANTMREPSEMFEWEIRVQAFQNSAAVVMCNRVGKEGNMEFSGESLAVGPNGEVLAKADEKEQILYAETDLSKVSEIRNSRPYTQLRRKDVYV